MIKNITESRYPSGATWAMKRIVDFIEDYASKSELNRNEINILDWGCGSGSDTLWLRQQGYNAFGIDINDKCIENAKILLKSHGYDDSIIRKSDINRTNFTKKYFHIIYSKQVLEHVSNLNSAALEFKRILSDNGAAFHIFPAHRHIVERHLYMPFVHWLPKNKIRKMLISLYVHMGIEPKWKGALGLSKKKKAEIYFNYSVNKTYYRSFDEVRKILENAGFFVQFNITDHPKLKEHKFIQPFLKNKISRKLIDILLLTFISIELVIVNN